MSIGASAPSWADPMASDDVWSPTPDDDQTLTRQFRAVIATRQDTAAGPWFEVSVTRDDTFDLEHLTQTPGTTVVEVITSDWLPPEYATALAAGLAQAADIAHQANQQP